MVCWLSAVALSAAAGTANAESTGGQIEAMSLGDRVLIRVLLQTEAFQ